MAENEISVWYIDDDKDDHDFFATAMKEINITYKLTHLYECSDLFKELEDQKKPDIIFLDLVLPKVHGVDCLKLLKGNDRYKAIPVIIISGSANEMHIDEIYGLGAHHHMVKPSAHINYVLSLKIIFEVNWKLAHPVPSLDNFFIKYDKSASDNAEQSAG